MSMTVLTSVGLRQLHFQLEACSAIARATHRVTSTDELLGDLT
jgi:hypothetical protein